MTYVTNAIDFISSVFAQFWLFAENNFVVGIMLYIAAVGAVIGLLMWLINSFAGIGGGRVSSPTRDKKGGNKS